MKEIYDELDMEIIAFGAEDIVATSKPPLIPDTDEDDDEGPLMPL